MNVHVIDKSFITLKVNVTLLLLNVNKDQRRKLKKSKM
jgi:hypothetical protein